VANTITAVLPSIFAGLNTVSRELIGFAGTVQRDATMERAAVGQTVTVPVVPAATGGNITPAGTPPDDGDATIGSKQVTISKAKYSPVRWTGEEQRALGPTGQYNRILGDQFAEAFRWLANQVEVDLAVAAKAAASRAYGTAGTAPFGTAGDLSDFAGVNRILDQNGAPQFGRVMIVNSDARFNLEGKQSVLFKANEAGTDDLLRQRSLRQVQGFQMGYSAGLTLHTKGTGSGYLVNNASGEAIGDTSITTDTGTGTILAGDVVTFASDTNKYVSGAAHASNTLTLNAPGLLQAAADNAAITVGNNYTPNVAFTRDAMVLAARPPAAPEGGDSAVDVQMVADPVSGIVFEIRLYREYRRVRFEVGLAWGVGVVKSNHIALLLG
jgi:hypothetical protein